MLLVTLHLKISKTWQYLSFGGVFYFRLGTYNVPKGPSANPYGKARSAEFDGTDGQTDGNQKCPSMFFTLFGDIEHGYDSRPNFRTQGRPVFKMEILKKCPLFQNFLSEMTPKKWHNFENISFCLFLGWFTNRYVAKF